MEPEKLSGEAADGKQRATDDDPAVLIQGLQRMFSRRKPERSLDLWSIQMKDQLQESKRLMMEALQEVMLMSRLQIQRNCCCCS
jgi:hypothetical protein